MDYSLLVGIHSLAPHELNSAADMRAAAGASAGAGEGAGDATTSWWWPRRQAAGEGQRAGAAAPMLAYQSAFTREGGGLRASGADDSAAGEVYVLGLVDMLQAYDWRKRLASGWKRLALQQRRHTLSTVPAHQYAARFLAFLQSKMQPPPPPLPQP